MCAIQVSFEETPPCFEVPQSKGKEAKLASVENVKVFASGE